MKNSNSTNISVLTQKLKTLLNNQWLFPTLIVYYGFAYILFGERYYLNDGLSMDGIVFSSFVKMFNASYYFDTYYVHRILPSFLVGGSFKLFSISTTNYNIYTAFQILNIISIAISCIFLKKTLLLLKVSIKNQLLAQILLVFNFAVLKMPFYLSVMTDTMAMCLSIMMLFFYLKKNMVGLIIFTIMACFTWQMLFFQGIILIALPFLTLPYSKVESLTKIIIPSLSSGLALTLCIFLIFVRKADTNVELVAKINKTLLPYSIAGVVLLFYFFSFILLNAHLLNLRSFFKKLKLSNIIIAFSLFIATLCIIYLLNPFPSKFYPLYNILTGTVTSALMWPLHTLVSHTVFWGVIMILLILFWKDFSKLLSQMGWGIVIAFGLNLFTFGIISETRCLANLLPWIIVFLIKAINKYSFSNIFYIVVTAFSIFASKIWLYLNPSKNEIYAMYLDKNGSMGFPDQKMWMHFGPWMSEKMYYLQGSVILLFLLILFLILYRIKIRANFKIEIVKKYN